MNTLLIIALLWVAVTADYSIEDYKAVRDSSRNFTGKVILVTGSSSGIGEGIVKLMSILGAKVVVTGTTDAKVKAVAKECEDLSPYKLKPLEVVADLTKSDDLNRVIAETVKTFGRLDVLVNNAGIRSQLTTILQTDVMKAWDQLYSLDLRAVVELTH
ncbi:unnamed protein product, partial [Oppiella nova]